MPPLKKWFLPSKYCLSNIISALPWELTPLEVSAAGISVEGRMIFWMSNEEITSVPSLSAGSFPRRVKFWMVFQRSAINLYRTRFINKMRISNKCASNHLTTSNRLSLLVVSEVQKFYFSFVMLWLNCSLRYIKSQGRNLLPSSGLMCSQTWAAHLRNKAFHRSHCWEAVGKTRGKWKSASFKEDLGGQIRIESQEEQCISCHNRDF